MLVIIKVISVHSFLKPMASRALLDSPPMFSPASPPGYSLSATGMLRPSHAGPLSSSPSSAVSLELSQASLTVFSHNSIPPHAKDVN